MEEKNKAALPVTQEEFEAMRRRYAGELMAIRRSVDALLDQNGLLPREEREAPVRYNCQGVQVENDGGLQETDDSNEYNAENLKNQTETETKPNANQTETETKPNGNPNVYVNVNENKKTK